MEMASPSNVAPARVDAEGLERQGFLLYRAKPNSHDAVCDAMRALARSLDGRVDLVTLDSSGDPDYLPVHTEGIYRAVPPRYFMLGCVTLVLLVVTQSSTTHDELPSLSIASNQS